MMMMMMMMMMNTGFDEDVDGLRGFAKKPKRQGAAFWKTT